MTTTTNLGLKKPASSDPINIADLNYNADVLDSIGGWESYNCLTLTSGAGATYIDADNSSVTVKVNKTLKRVVIAATLKIKADLASSVSEFRVCDMSSITGYASMIPLVPLRYMFTSKAGNYTFGAQRANNSALCTVWVIDGTIAENSTIYFSFEYTYF